MLNTESRLAAAIIWLAILAICARFAWTFFQLPPPIAILSTLASSRLAAWISAHQVLVAGLGGFAGLALAYVLDGWRDRAERRHVVERAEQRLASVLAREAAHIASSLDPAARSSRERLTETIDAADRVILSRPIGDFASLGAAATAAIGALRQSIRRLTRLVEAGAEHGDSALAAAVSAAARSARDAAHVLEICRSKGPAAADRMRVLHTESTEHPALEAPPAPRLLPAA